MCLSDWSVYYNVWQSGWILSVLCNHFFCVSACFCLRNAAILSNLFSFLMGSVFIMSICGYLYCMWCFSEYEKNAFHILSLEMFSV